jgi:hypothetical protein
MIAVHWQRVSHLDPRARAIADRHYSRQTVGAREFTRPGNKIVLLCFDAANRPLALWVSQRPDPASGVARLDGLDAWDCAYFRNEGSLVKASVLIREAVAITVGIWGPGGQEGPVSVPADGFVTTVNPHRVAPTMRRGEPTWGYCFQRAGWIVRPERTKARDLVMLQLPATDLAGVAPVVVPWNTALFGALAVAP